jgi:hypothetical protein
MAAYKCSGKTQFLKTEVHANYLYGPLDKMNTLAN